MQSPKIDLLGTEEEYSIIFFSSSSASDSKELAMEITFLDPDFLGESNYMKLCKNQVEHCSWSREVQVISNLAIYLQYSIQYSIQV